PGAPLFPCTRFNAFLRFSGSHISSINRSTVPSLSGSWSATRSSALPSVLGASLLGSSLKASSSWFFCRFLPLSPIPYSPSHFPFLSKGTVQAFPKTFPDRRPLVVSPLSGEYPGRVVRLLLATMPSADFSIALRVSLDSLSPLPDTMQISRGKYDRLPHTTTESTLGDLDGYGLRGLRATRPPPRASYPVFVHRLVRLLHASFRPHLTVDALALCYPSPPSGWGKTFTSKLSYNARRTVTCDGSDDPSPGVWTFEYGKSFIC